MLCTPVGAKLIQPIVTNWQIKLEKPRYKTVFHRLYDFLWKKSYEKIYEKIFYETSVAVKEHK